MDYSVELSLSEMAYKIKPYFPELDYRFIREYLRAYRGFGLYESQLAQWLKFFYIFVNGRKDFF